MREYPLRGPIFIDEAVIRRLVRRCTEHVRAGCRRRRDGDGKKARNNGLGQPAGKRRRKQRVAGAEDRRLGLKTSMRKMLPVRERSGIDLLVGQKKRGGGA